MHLPQRRPMKPSKLRFDKVICKYHYKYIAKPCPAWDYFGYPATKCSQIITNRKVVCQLCHHLLNNTNPTNMLTHLANKHQLLPKENGDSICCFENRETLTTFQNIMVDKIYFSLSILRWENVDQQKVLMLSINSVSTGDIPKLEINTINIKETGNDLDWLQLDNCVAALVDNRTADDRIKCIFDDDIPIRQCLYTVIEAALHECFELSVVKEVVSNVQSMLRRHSVQFPKNSPYFCLKQLHTINVFCDATDKPDEFYTDSMLPILMEPSKEIVKILEPVRLAVERLVEKNHVAGIAKPFVAKLLQDLNHVRCSNIEFDENYVFVESISDTIHHIIERHLNDYLNENNQFLTIAKFMDPRFHLKCEADEWAIIHDVIDSHKQNGQANEIDLELMTYQFEPPLDFGQCPMQWWSSHNIIYPILKNIADLCMCVPAINKAAYTLCKLR